MKKQTGFEYEKLLVLPDYVLSELSQHELISQLYVTDIGYFPRAEHHHREREQGADTTIFIYCADGEGWYALDGGEVTHVRSQSLIVLPAGIPHEYGASEGQPWSIYWFHLKGSAVQTLIDSYALSSDTLQLPLGASAKLLELFDHCYHILIDKAYSHPHQLHISQTMRHLISTIGLSAVRSRQEARKELHLERAVSYMNEHMNRMISLQELAEHVGLSRQHLIHLFNIQTGSSPIDYFIRMKIQKAGQMLDLTDLSVKAIGSSLGIQDPYYFSRLFKKVMGSSPSEYRNIPKG